MEFKEIKNREDVFKLVNAFYAKIRKDELLGPIFNKHIPEDHWPKHIEHITDFWMGRLFGVIAFKGNPAEKHRQVDEGQGYQIKKSHFDHWVNLWTETVTKQYNCKLADKAIMMAGRIAQGQMGFIMQNRAAKHRPEKL